MHITCFVSFFLLTFDWLGYDLQMYLSSENCIIKGKQSLIKKIYREHGKSPDGYYAGIKM
jgi:hypothetical protein